MSVLARLAKRSSMENPSTPISDASLAEWISGGSGKKYAGVNVTEKSVYGIPAYYRGVVLTAGTIASMPVKVYERNTRQRVRVRTVLDSPNPRQRPTAFKLTTFANAITWGNAYALKVRNGADIVTQTWPIHPSKIRVESVEPDAAAPDGKVFLYTQPNGRQTVLTSWEIFHLPYVSIDGIVGLSALECFRRSLSIGLAAEESAGATFANGSRLSGVLTTADQLDEVQAKRWKARWRELYSGPQSAGDIAIIDNGGDFKPITIPPNDAQLLESRKWTVTEIARMVGVPPHMIGDVDRSTSWGTGIESQFIGWVQTGLGLWIKLADELMTADLLPGGWDSGPWFAETDLNGLLRGDSAARAAFYHQQVTDGLMTRNEGRAKENAEPVEGGDDFLLPAGVLPATLAEQRSKVDSLGALVRAGFEPAAAAKALGLDPIDHTGLVPITVTVDPSQLKGSN